MAKVKLNKRELTFIIAGVAMVSLAIVIPVARNAQAAYEKSQAQVEQARARLQDARDLRMLIEEERRGQEAIKERLAQRPANFSLYQYTNRSLRKLELESRANLSTDRTRASALEGVRLDLKGVSMKELVDFLHLLYKGDNLIFVQRVSELRPAKDGKGLDCQLQLMAPRS